MRPVGVLFARTDSVYKTMPGCDVYDIERDALTWPGGCPVVAHPPCRAWGAFSMFAKPRDGEKDLARWAVHKIREWGGVLEHPARSALWPDMSLPEPGQRDAWGGWTLPLNQHWWGHRASKPTKLYIVGCEPANIPDMPMRLNRPEFVIGDVGRAANGTKRPEISKAEREHTPPEFATWLLELARRCWKQPIAAWEPCGCCAEYWCNIHNMHAFECDCPPIEAWSIDPYSAKRAAA